MEANKMGQVIHRIVSPYTDPWNESKSIIFPFYPYDTRVNEIVHVACFQVPTPICLASPPIFEFSVIFPGQGFLSLSLWTILFPSLNSQTPSINFLLYEKPRLIARKNILKSNSQNKTLISSTKLIQRAIDSILFSYGMLISSSLIQWFLFIFCLVCWENPGLLNKRAEWFRFF